MRTLLGAIAGATLYFAAIGGAAADEAWDKCADDNADISIAGCTEVLTRGNEESDADRARAHRNRGLAYKLKGDIDSAIEDFSKAVVFNPDYAEAYISRGLAYDSKSEYDLAIADYSRAIELDPGSANAYNNRATVFAAQGNAEAAFADYDAAIAADPKYEEAYYNRGLLDAEQGDYDRAIADYTAAIAISADSETYNNRGVAYSSKGDPDRAIEDFTKAIELKFDYALAYFNRAASLIDKGDTDGALADFDKSIELDPDEGDVYYHRGLLYEGKGDLAKALIDLRVAGRLIPEDQSLHGDAVAKITEIEGKFALSALTAKGSETAGAKAVIPTDERRIALVIGNGDYQSSAALPNPPNDAGVIAAALKTSGFSEVTLVRDLDRDGFVESLKAFAAEAEDADWAVIYYAGHGIEMAGVNYLVPTDAKLERDRDVPDEAIALDRVMSAVEGARKLRLVILDACRNNPFATRMKVTTAGRAIGRGLARVEPTQATLVAYAAKDGSIALDGEGSNSPFAAALAKHLVEPGVEINKLFRLVRSDVLAATENGQEPFVYGSLPPEDFFFVAPQ